MSPDLDDYERLAHALRTGVEALKLNQPSKSIRFFEEVVNDEGLKASTELWDIRARACSLYGQALSQLHQLDEALLWLDEALRLMNGQNAEEDIQSVHTLREEILAEIQNQHREVLQNSKLQVMADTPIEDVLAQPGHILDRAERLIHKANADWEIRQDPKAKSHAVQALQIAEKNQDPRTEVLARLAIARMDSESQKEQLHLAHQTADKANNTNLITLVATTARLLDIELPSQEGPLI